MNHFITPRSWIHNGNVLIEKTSAGRSVIKESTAWLLTSAMEDVVTQGTGTACQLDNMTVAGKTGTTDAYNDLWFVGIHHIIPVQYGLDLT